MPRFEYLTVYVNAAGAYQTSSGAWKKLTELGDQGWELVSVVNSSTGDLVAFLKRSTD